jgi:hypothetical protein
VPDGTEAGFPLVVVLPATTGEVLFKTIQTTEAGELAWIEEEESEGEGAFPSPRLTLVADPSATTTTTGPSSTPTIDEVASSTTERPAGTSLEASQRDDGDSSLAPWVIGSAVAALAVIGVGGYALQRRRG